MAYRKSMLALLVAIIAGITQGVSIPLRQKEVDVTVHRPWRPLSQRQADSEPNTQKKSLYWFGNFTVGDAKNLELLIDTGSPFILINPGKYRPSKNMKAVPPKFRKYNATYEGINKAGTGYETVFANVVRDSVSAGSLTAHNQGLGNVTSFKVQDAPPLKSAFEGDGIIGFGFEPPAFVNESTTPLLPTWVGNLCASKAISECRFALAYGTNRRGLQVVGEVDKKLFKGQLTTAPVHDSEFGGWTTRADVSVNGRHHFPNQSILLDDGTSNIQAPLDVARAIFKLLGYKYKTTVGGPNPFDPSQNVTFDMATYPCDDPPTLTFTVPAKSDLMNRPKGLPFSQKSKSFDVLKSVWSVKKTGNNTCTAVLAGTNALSDPKSGAETWLIGQPFYQGHYVDHFMAGTKASLSFADLKDPCNVGAS